MAMFSGARNQATSSGGNLVEFKAGRCKMETGSAPNKRKVVPEKEKGLVYVKQTGDQLTHFCWKNRESGALIDDLIIFPGDTEFKEVNGCTDGQVFMLKFKTTDDRRLFWVQDGAIDKEIIQKVNDALNKPPSQQRMGARGGSADRVSAPEPTSFGDNEGIGALGGLDQRQLMQLLHFMNPTNSSSTNESALQNILSTGGSESGSGASTGSNGQESQTSAATESISNQLQHLLRPGANRNRTEVDLADVATGERVVATAKDNTEKLSAHVPECSNLSQEVIDTVHSPMFRQAATSFGHALQTGQMGPVLDQFGIDKESKEAAQKGDLLEFAKKLTEAEKNKQTEEEKVKEEEKVEEPREPDAKRGKREDEMDLD